jgi:hypothetical protein
MPAAPIGFFAHPLRRGTSFLQNFSLRPATLQGIEQTCTRKSMDILYAGAIAAFFVATMALVFGCARLGERQ